MYPIADNLVSRKTDYPCVRMGVTSPSNTCIQHQKGVQRLLKVLPGEDPRHQRQYRRHSEEEV